MSEQIPEHIQTSAFYRFAKADNVSVMVKQWLKYWLRNPNLKESDILFNVTIRLSEENVLLTEHVRCLINSQPPAPIIMQVIQEQHDKILEEVGQRDSL